MTDWTFFFTVVGIAYLTGQLFHLIDFIERPTHYPYKVSCLPEARTLLVWNSLREKQWTFWKS